jgi:hypothetical protein
MDRRKGGRCSDYATRKTDRQTGRQRQADRQINADGRVVDAPITQLVIALGPKLPAMPIQSPPAADIGGRRHRWPGIYLLDCLFFLCCQQAKLGVHHGQLLALPATPGFAHYALHTASHSANNSL